MPFIMLGKWSSAGIGKFKYERIYIKGRWTPFVKMTRRYKPYVNYTRGL